MDSRDSTFLGTMESEALNRFSPFRFGMFWTLQQWPGGSARLDLKKRRGNDQRSLLRLRKIDLVLLCSA
jgi:hypothetical protein